MNLGNHSSLRAEPHNDILARYDSHFRTQLAEGADLIRTAQAIRYQVYCLERKFESRTNMTAGWSAMLSTGVAVHALLFHRPTGDAIGTARLIPFTDMDVLQPIRQILRANGLRARDDLRCGPPPKFPASPFPTIFAAVPTARPSAAAICPAWAWCRSW